MRFSTGHLWIQSTVLYQTLLNAVCGVQRAAFICMSNVLYKLQPKNYLGCSIGSISTGTNMGSRLSTPKYFELRALLNTPVMYNVRYYIVVLRTVECLSKISELRASKSFVCP